MKIRLHFRDEELGTAETGPGGAVSYAGPNPEGVRGRVEYYARATGLSGEALLRHVLARSQGQNWAEEVA
jgi:hypothetical protein